MYWHMLVHKHFDGRKKWADSRRLVLFTAVATMFLAAGALSAATQPKFDVASIKPCIPGNGAGGGRGAGGGGGPYLSTSPGRLSVTCMTVSDLIGEYVGFFGEDDGPVNSGGQSETRPIRGGPAWVYSERYTIAAETDDATAKDRPTVDTPRPPG